MPEKKTTRQRQAKRSNASAKPKTGAGASGQSGEGKRNHDNSLTPGQNKPLPADVVATALARNQTTMEDHYRHQRQHYIQYFIIIILVAGLIALAMRDPKPVYFAVNPQGEIIQLDPVSEPMKASEVKGWITRAVTDSYSLSFVRDEKQLANAQKYFTEDGFEDFMTALRRSKFRQTVNKNRYTTSAVAQTAPRITKKGVLDGRYAWQMQFKMLLTYEAQDRETQNLTVTVLVVRVPKTKKTSSGLGIAQIVAS